MATLLDNLKTRRDAIGVELASITSASPGGKPSYSINGQAVDHTEYRKSLYDELAMIEQRILAAEGPIEVETQGIV